MGILPVRARQVSGINKPNTCIYGYLVGLLQVFGWCRFRMRQFEIGKKPAEMQWPLAETVNDQPIAKFSIHETFELFETDVSDFSVNLKSSNAYFEAGFRLVYPMKPCSLTLNIGYQYQPMAGQKMYEENKDEPFEAMDSKYLYPEWSGLRISVGISKSLKFLHF